MVIKSIQLKNFRQYRGKQNKIIFSTDKENNVTVILGVNTSGKTTLIQSFKWCLYGIDSVSFQTQEVLNIQVAESLSSGQSEEVSVIIELVHDNVDYTIMRTQEFNKKEIILKGSKDNVTMTFKHEDGSQIPINQEEIKEKIDKILPEELSEYFFFDGEKLSNINNKKDVTRAVHNLLGLNVLDNTISHLKRVLNKFVPDSDNGRNLQQEIEEKQEELESLNKNDIDLNKEILSYENRGNEIYNQILSNKDAQNDQKRRMDLEKLIESKNTDIKEHQSRILKDFSSNSINFFATPAMEKALKVIESAETQGEGIPDMRTGAIDYILKRGKCLCGVDLNMDVDCKKYLMHERSLLPPEQIGTILRFTSEKYKLNIKQASNFKIDTPNNIVNLTKNINQKNEFELEHQDLSEKIKGTINVTKLEEENEKNKSKIEQLRENKEANTLKQGAITRDIETINKTIESESLRSNVNKRIIECRNYTEQLLEYFTLKHDNRKKEIKDKLHDSVMSTFKKTYHGTRDLEMSDDYIISLVSNVNGKKLNTDESKGLEAVKNFSFICGLIEIAREKVSSNSNDIDLNTEAYPLVMDAPFSNTDEQHIESISKVIPTVAEQVILMIMEKDWQYAQKTLGTKVNKQYHIIKENNSDTYSVIKEV